MPSMRVKLASLFDREAKPGRIVPRSSRHHMRQHAQSLGVGFAEMVLVLQVLYLLWRTWNDYKRRNPTFVAAKDTGADPQSWLAFVEQAENESDRSR
jgi:hypothetical protein